MLQDYTPWQGMFRTDDMKEPFWDPRQGRLRTDDINEPSLLKPGNVYRIFIDEP
jgi:hypothetical protein